MNQKNAAKVRIGVTNCLNTAPIYQQLQTSVAENEWQLVDAPPAALIEKLEQKEIDLGFVASYAYGANPDNYKILSGLSISECGAAGTVFLFSDIPLEQLDQQPILLSHQAETSLSLLRIILEDFHKVRPVYLETDKEPDITDHEFKAILAMGDTALKMEAESTHLYQYDLGDIWKKETGLPMVLTICLARREFVEEHPDLLAGVYKELLCCRDQGVEELDRVCEASAPSIPMSIPKCRNYLEAMEYDFGTQKRHSVETFFDFLIKRGDIGSTALPLKFYANPL